MDTVFVGLRLECLSAIESAQVPALRGRAIRPQIAHTTKVSLARSHANGWAWSAASSAGDRRLQMRGEPDPQPFHSDVVNGRLAFSWPVVSSWTRLITSITNKDLVVKLHGRS